MTIQEQKQKALAQLKQLEKEYEVSMVVRTIKLEEHAGIDHDNLRDGFKLYYSVIDDALLFGRYWVENLTPGETIYKETTLTPDELTQVKQWKGAKK